MGSTSVSRTINASPEKVWHLIGGFTSLPDWMSYISTATADEGGRIRRLESVDGDTIVERLIDYSDEERYYSYRIEEGPFPVKNEDYLATIRVHPIAADPAVSEVQWSVRFTPAGEAESDVSELFADVFRKGLDGVSDKFTR